MNTPAYKVVVILVNYGNEHDTIVCLKSLKEQNEQSFGVIVVDNPTENHDETESVSPGMGAGSKQPSVSAELRFREVFDDLHFISCKTNIGFGRANNKGIQYALKNIDFQYLFLLNNDTWICEDTITLLIEAFGIDYRIGISTGKIMYGANKNIVWYGGGDMNFKRGWPKITDYNKEADTDGANRSRFVTFISGCAMMFSKESISKLRGFDEDMFMYCEDMELSVRALKDDYLLYYQAGSVIYHNVQGSFRNAKAKGMKWNNPNLPFLFYHIRSNQWITMRKHVFGWEFIVFNCLFWIDYTLKTLYFVVMGRIEMISVGLKTIRKIFKYARSVSISQ